jgi:hypothetical protein
MVIMNSEVISANTHSDIATTPLQLAPARRQGSWSMTGSNSRSWLEQRLDGTVLVDRFVTFGHFAQ